MFYFSFLNKQIIGARPPSQATVAFALVVSLIIALNLRWQLRIILLGLALFIGIGVTFCFYWLPEFIAGLLLGMTIKMVVGSFSKIKVAFLN